MKSTRMPRAVMSLSSREGLHRDRETKTGEGFPPPVKISHAKPKTSALSHIVLNLTGSIGDDGPGFFDVTANTFHGFASGQHRQSEDGQNKQRLTHRSFLFVKLVSQRADRQLVPDAG